MDKIAKEIQNDRERIDSKLANMEDSGSIKTWVLKQIWQSEKQQDEALKNESEVLRKKIDKIYLDNLLVPELIGPPGSECTF